MAFTCFLCERSNVLLMDFVVVFHIKSKYVKFGKNSALYNVTFVRVYDMCLHLFIVPFFLWGFARLASVEMNAGVASDVRIGL